MAIKIQCVPGALVVQRVEGIPTVFPADSRPLSAEDNLLKVVYDKGPVNSCAWDSFDTLKGRIISEWTKLPKSANVISNDLANKMEAVQKRQESASNLVIQ